jgi:hypothetical protein
MGETNMSIGDVLRQHDVWTVDLEEDLERVRAELVVAPVNTAQHAKVASGTNDVLEPPPIVKAIWNEIRSKPATIG